MIVLAVLGLCGLALAQEAAGATNGEDISPEKIAGALSGLLATGAWGGLWKGVVAGVGRGLMGFFSKHQGTKFEAQYLVSAALSGAVAGLLMGLLEVPFDDASGWLATVGTTEVLNKMTKALWRRWASDHVGEAVTRHAARHLMPPSGPPSTE
jgi:hypothetical protein